jgi:hypothetical protein
MSLPNEADFVTVEWGNNAQPQVFTILCGIENVTINQTVNTSDRFRRNCAKPASIPSRKVRVTGKQWDVTGGGVINVDEFDTFNSLLGVSADYRLTFGKRVVGDTTGTGETLGVFTGSAVMTAANINMGTDEGTGEITLAGEDELVWTPDT